MPNIEKQKDPISKDALEESFSSRTTWEREDEMRNKYPSLFGE